MPRGPVTSAVPIRLETPIARPASEVFAFLTATGNYARWQEGIVRIEQIDPGPWRAGTRMRTVHAFLWWRNLVDESEITAIGPGASFATRGSAGGSRYTEEFRVEARPEGSCLTYTAAIVPGGAFRFIRPLAAWSFRGQMRRSFGKLKVLLEHPPTPATVTRG